MRVIQAHYYSVLVKRQPANMYTLTARRVCRADKHMANRHLGDGKAEKTRTSLLFLRRGARARPWPCLMYDLCLRLFREFCVTFVLW